MASLGCATSTERVEDETVALDDSRRKASNVEVAELEVRFDGTDRFVHCAPPGEIGQSWIPPLPPWTPSHLPEAGAAVPPDEATASPIAREERGPARTERLLAATRFDFKRCYDNSRFVDPTQEGRVAIALRVGESGRVAAVDIFGACGLSVEAIRCMKESASSLRFSPPEGGQDTVLIPVAFGRPSGAPRSPTANDAYTNSAYIAIEGARRELHTCETEARGAGREPLASATFNLDVDARGHVRHVRVDPWSGDQELLACAAHVLEDTHFPKPPAGAGTILARVAFNRRTGAR